MILDPVRNSIVAGARFDLDAEGVIALCRDYEPLH
jgi:hypothetical protein